MTGRGAPTLGRRALLAGTAAVVAGTATGCWPGDAPSAPTPSASPPTRAQEAAIFDLSFERVIYAHALFLCHSGRPAIPTGGSGKRSPCFLT